MIAPHRIFSALAVLLASVSASAETGVTQKEVLIGSCYGKTGRFEARAEAQIDGAKAYLDEINRSGGVHGRKIRLIEGDDRSEPDGAIECFKKTLVDGGAFAGAFFTGNVVVSRHSTMAEVNKIPVTGWLTGSDFLYDPFKRYVVGVRASYSDEARELVDGLWEAGLRRIAVIYQQDAFGSAVLDGVKRALAAHASSPVTINSFSRTAPNIESAYDEVGLSFPQAIVIVGPAAPAAAIVKRARSKGRDTLFLAVSVVGTEDFVRDAGADAEGTIISEVFPPYSTSEAPAIKHYLKNLKKYLPDQAPSFAGFEGFVDAMVLVEGLKRAGVDLTREGYLDAIESIHDLDLGLGPDFRLNFGPKRHKGFDRGLVTIIRGGKPVAFSDWASLKKS